MSYERYRAALADEPLPAALIDLDAVDRNLERLLAPVRAAGKTLRVASKSVRCVELLRYLLERGDVCAGIMAYTVTEAAHLVEHGFDDVLVAYPSAQPSDARLLAELNQGDAHVSIVVDSPEHLARLEAGAADIGGTIPLIVEVDMSWKPLGAHLGVRRSPLRTATQAADLADSVGDHPHLHFAGVMGYEAQIAGLQDANPFAPLLNPAKKLIRRRSRPSVVRTRREIGEALAARGLTYEVFNGGGTGSIHWSTQEDVLTEVTAGSGFLDSHLFDYYSDLSFDPAALFALQVVRVPGPGFVTCHGGGWVASGEPGLDKHPVPYLPPGLKLLGMEACGEVQTPLIVPKGLEIGIGDPVFFRHAKAGELAEHTNEYLFVRGDAVERRAPTYRGEGRCFLG
ncbi:MAG: amino acid deaminase/aldolase [Proteobacteria bacterium]|nr:amino acid deaminase/aldolase [Pseudomonadota bacterium]